MARACSKIQRVRLILPHSSDFAALRYRVTVLARRDVANEQAERVRDRKYRSKLTVSSATLVLAHRPILA
jgi:hypothetical protein